MSWLTFQVPHSHVGATPAVKTNLRTGETCGVHGRYRHPGFGPMEDVEDEAPQVVLLPGDIAPCWLQLGPHGEYLDRESVCWEQVATL